jgi:uncharacterized Zn finger protein (UPF0148 family)
MATKLQEWLCCPNCGFDSFTDDDLPSEGRITCPNCETSTKRRINHGTIPTVEEIAQVTGQDTDSVERLMRAATQNNFVEDDGEV